MEYVNFVVLNFTSVKRCNMMFDKFQKKVLGKNILCIYMNQNHRTAVIALL